MDLQEAPSIEDHKIVFDGMDFSESYNIHQVNGQLVATFNNFGKRTLKRHTEIFIKRLPRDCLLKEIFKFVHKCGRIYQIRLLMDFSGFNRGFCFVSFFDTFTARKALFLLNGMEIRDNVPVLVKLSLDNNQLLMSRVPEYLTYGDVNEGLSFLHGLKSVTRAGNRTQSHSSSFLLHFNTHKCAVDSRKLLWPHVRLWNTQVYVDWAVPKIVRQSVKVFFYNMPVNVSRMQVFNIINRRINVLKVVSFNLFERYGHIAFQNEAAAVEAARKLTGLKIKQQVVQFRIGTIETQSNDTRSNRSPSGDQFQLLDRSPTTNMNHTYSFESTLMSNENSSFLISDTPSFWNNPYMGNCSPSNGSWYLDSFSPVYSSSGMNYSTAGNDSFNSPQIQQDEEDRRWSMMNRQFF